MGIYGVMGYPIGHSMSPIMHNREFEALGLSNHYAAFNVQPSQLKTAIEGVRALHIKGLNVTIPHKVAVMEYLDEIDDEAQLIGAVNTIKNEDGRLIGSNTDGQGYLRSLLPLLKQRELNRKKILVIGAGGASRAIVTSLARHGVEQLDITNRTVSKADKLVEHVKRFVPSTSAELSDAEKNLSNYDIIVNTTSVGMSPHINEVPINIDNVKEGAIVSDLIYNPLTTKFMQKARDKGAITDNGVGMFVYQGALSFEKWTGIEPSIERMTETVLKKLGG